jgi:hypothetical protein
LNDENVGAMTISNYIKLVVAQMARAPVATCVLLAFASASVGVAIQRNNEFSTLEVTISVVAVMLAVLFLKTALMFFAFRIFNDQRFDGSFLLVAILLTPILILALLLGASVAGPHIDGFPSEELPILLVGLYVIVVVFLFAAFRASHWILGSIIRKRPFTSG